MDIQSRDYPCLLKEIKDPPKRLYYKGNFNSNIFESCVSVVGSRIVSNSNKRIIKHLFSTLSKSITIVSGFMSGVDAEAHKQALNFGLKTIAVMPCGIDHIHPENQVDLYNEILCSDGLVISEYDYDFKPEVWSYPRRNRIVAGIAKVTVVIEAKLNSGSLITARLANCYGRRVLVPKVPRPLSGGISLLKNEFAEDIESGVQINEYIEMFDKNRLEKKNFVEYQLGFFDG